MADDGDLTSPAGRQRFLMSVDPRNVDPTLAPTLRRILDSEIVYRSQEGEHSYEPDDSDYFENIYQCSLLLHAIGDVEDVEQMWRAKTATFDTYAGYDIETLFGAGIVNTMAHLESNNLNEILDYIGSRPPSEDEIAEWFRLRVQYYYGS